MPTEAEPHQQQQRDRAVVPAAKKARTAAVEEEPKMLTGLVAALSRATQQSFNTVNGHYSVTYNLNVNMPKEL